MKSPLLLCAVAAFLAQAGAAPSPDLTRLPMAFEANRGQVNERAKFLSRGPGYTLFLAADEAVLALASERVLRIQFDGANRSARLHGADRLPGKVSYFRGQDPDNWISGAPTYQRVRYSEIYEGIDLVFYGNQNGKLEYDFEVAPGADPSEISLHFDGADELELTQNGQLLASVDDQQIAQHAPVVYQRTAQGREPVEGRYVIRDDNRVAFELGAYDPERELVIDPVLRFSSYIGGGMGSQGRDRARGLTLGPDYSIYIVGDTQTTDFPVLNAFEPAPQSSWIMKLDPTGTQVVYASYINMSIAVDVAVNLEGVAYVTGIADSMSPVTPGAFQADRRLVDAYVAKISADGTVLEAATRYGGRSAEEGNSIDLDANGDPYVTGKTSSRDLPTTPGSFQPERSDPNNTDGVFVAKFTADLSDLQWATHIDTSETDVVRHIVVHDFCPYIVGSTSADDYPTTPGVVQPDKNGAPRDLFITKLSADGSSIVFSTFFGGDNLDTPQGMAIDDGGYVYVTGDTNGFRWPTTPGAFMETRNLNTGGFVIKLSPDATSVIYSTYLDERSGGRPEGIAVDSQGAAHIAGVSTSDVYPVTADALQPMALNRSTMGFYTVLSADGSKQLYSSYHGGEGDDFIGEIQSFLFGEAVAVRNCQAYFIGRTDSPDFPLLNAFQPALAGGDWDAFISKVDPFTADGDPHIGCNAVVLATGTPAIRKLAPRSIGTAFGSDFTTETDLTPGLEPSGAVSNIIADACVEVGGQRGAAFAGLPSQMNFMVSPDAPLGWQPVVVIQGCGTANEVRSEPQYVEIVPVLPAFFNFVNNVDGVNPIAAIDNATGALIGPAGLFGLTEERTQGVTTTPAQPGQIIVAFPTGLGSTNPALGNGQIPGAAFPITGSFSLTLGGVTVPAEDIFYVGAAPCCAGLDQVTFRVPASLGAGNHPLILTVDGVSSPVGPFIAVEP